MPIISSACSSTATSCGVKSPAVCRARACIASSSPAESEFFIDTLLVRIHCIIVMIRWTGLAPWEFEFPFPGNLTSTFLEADLHPC